MNYLAHVYLSGSNKSISIGNFIADHVKGKAYLNYPQTVQKGILLHRKIDLYSDNHPLFKKNVYLLFPEFRHYSRVIVDMFFDHFLASKWESYHPDPLEVFSKQFFSMLKKNSEILPYKTKKMLPFITKYNWFIAYRSLEGLESILYQMSERTKFPSNMHLAISNLKNNYADIDQDFQEFFKELRDFVRHEKTILLRIH